VWIRMCRGGELESWRVGWRVVGEQKDSLQRVLGLLGEGQEAWGMGREGG
jgi:hypothetical protein